MNNDEQKMQEILNEVYERDEESVKVLSFGNTKDRTKRKDTIVDINTGDYTVVAMIENNAKVGDKSLLQYDCARLNCYFPVTKEEYDFLKGYMDSDCYFVTKNIDGLYLARQENHDGSYSTYEYNIYNINSKRQLIINKYSYYEATSYRDDSSETIELATIAL